MINTRCSAVEQWSVFFNTAKAKQLEALFFSTRQECRYLYSLQLRNMCLVNCTLVTAHAAGGVCAPSSLRVVEAAALSAVAALAVECVRMDMSTTLGTAHAVGLQPPPISAIGSSK